MNKYVVSALNQQGKPFNRSWFAPSEASTRKHFTGLGYKVLSVELQHRSW